jgi:glycosyltransferase involved in cell wall biosynthesis
MPGLVAISDVSIGYGTPQLTLLAGSVAEHYGIAGTIIEPAQPEAPPRHGMFPQFRVRRINTMAHPHSEAGRQEYLWRAAEVINEIRPDVLIVCCTYSLPVLFRLRHRPRQVLYYSVESISFYGEFDVEMNQWTGGLVDVVLFPEENRAVNEVRRYGFEGARKVVVYNTSKRTGEIAEGPLPAALRNGRVLHSGTISKEQTLAQYFISELINTPIDLYGPLKLSSDAEREAYLDILTHKVRYKGFVSSAELARIRPQYLYSIVIWNPTNENQFYAAPNKFFESVADGVPPIAAPHPQCKALIERYGCGLLMEDWSFDSFRGALDLAHKLSGTPEWERMAANCLAAARAELNWDAQFEKVRRQLN